MNEKMNECTSVARPPITQDSCQLITNNLVWIDPSQKAYSSPQKDEEDRFTGHRMNSKMQVFSGYKSACLPKIITMHPGAVRTNSINSVCEGWGVLCSILESIVRDQL
jgi:hypothetical protein